MLVLRRKTKTLPQPHPMLAHLWTLSRKTCMSAPIERSPR
jgi:hypothetical protein